MSMASASRFNRKSCKAACCRYLKYPSKHSMPHDDIGEMTYDNRYRICILLDPV